MKKITVFALSAMIVFGIVPSHMAFAAPTIKVTTPNGGESYDTLDDITIKWTDTVTGYDTEYASIRFYKLKSSAWDPSHPSEYLENSYTGATTLRVTGYPSNGFGVTNVNKYDWTIPSSVLPGYYVADISIVYWNGVNTGFGSTNDLSDLPFEIKTDSTTAAGIPKITSVSPTTVAIGEELTVNGSAFSSATGVNFKSSTNAISAPDSPTIISGSQMKFKVPAIVTPGQYTIIVFGQNGENQSAPFTITAAPAGTVGTHDEGTNVLANGVVYRILDKKLHPYTSAGAFLSYKFNSWAGVVAANSADSALPVSDYITPRNGSLINDNGTVYLITEGRRAGFTSEAVFTGLGYSFKNVYPGDTSFMESASLINSTGDQHPYGTLVNDGGTLYVMVEYGARQAIPSMDVLESWGYWTAEAVPANRYDQEATVTGVEGPRVAWRMNI